MHTLEVEILQAFKQEPAKSFTTTELVRAIFKEEYGEIKRQLHGEEKREIRKGYAQKARLHRKLLYHTNKLVEQQLLAVAGIKGKGEKLFRLSFDEGELIVKEARKKIVIMKPSSVTTAIDGYEQRGLIRKYRPDNWLNKQNGVLLDCESFSGLAALQQRLLDVYPGVNDTIALKSFETILQRSTPEQIEPFLRHLALDAQDYDMMVSVLIDVAKIEQERTVLDAIRILLAEGERNINFVLVTTARLFTRRQPLFHDLFALFQEHATKMTLQNADLFRPPIFYGRTGAYAIGPDDWEHYERQIKGVADGCDVGGISVVVDINRFFREQPSASAFREMLERTAQALFAIEERKRRQGEGGSIAPNTPDGKKGFFRIIKHHIRFWNYDWAETERYLILDLLGSVQEGIRRFCRSEEIIFKSCGLPIRFQIGLSTTFAKFDQDFFSERRYNKTVVESLKDLQTQEMNHYLHIRERLFKIFDGADRLRFFFTRGIAVDELLRCGRYLLSSHDLPAFTFDFRGKKGELKLTSFLEES